MFRSIKYFGILDLLVFPKFWDMCDIANAHWIGLRSGAIFEKGTGPSQQHCGSLPILFLQCNPLQSARAGLFDRKDGLRIPESAALFFTLSRTPTGESGSYSLPLHVHAPSMTTILEVMF
jgi:hypothetical protein